MADALTRRLGYYTAALLALACLLPVPDQLPAPGSRQLGGRPPSPVTPTSGTPGSGSSPGPGPSATVAVPLPPARSARPPPGREPLVVVASEEIGPGLRPLLRAYDESRGLVGTMLRLWSPSDPGARNDARAGDLWVVPRLAREPPGLDPAGVDLEARMALVGPSSRALPATTEPGVLAGRGGDTHRPATAPAELLQGVLAGRLASAVLPRAGVPVELERRFAIRVLEGAEAEPLRFTIRVRGTEPGSPGHRFLAFLRASDQAPRLAEAGLSLVPPSPGR